MADDMAPGQPMWWMRRLHARIVARRPYVQKLWRYHDGEHPLAFASQKFLQAFGGLFSAYADNWCPLIVAAYGQRMHVDGFRFGKNPAADDDAWGIWQANNMDAQSELAIWEALITGESYVTAWVDSDGDDQGIELTVEPASNAVVEIDPKNPRRRLAGLRCWLDEKGYERAELFLPDAVHMFRSTNVTDRELYTVIPSDQMWAIDDEVSPDGTMPNPAGVVPMVPLTNNPRLLRHRYLDTTAQSEIAAVLAQQDALNVLSANMLVAAERHALPQRWATGLEIKRDPETNQVIPPFKDTDTLWQSDGPSGEVAFGQFQAADLGNYVKAIDTAVQHIASQTQVPPHYFYLGGGQPPSGESIRSAEAGLVAKVKSKHRHFGEAFEELMRVAFALQGDPRATETRAETIWADPETRTYAELADALLKQQALGVPQPALWSKAGYSPTEIDRFHAMKAQELLLSSAMPGPAGLATGRPQGVIEPTVTQPAPVPAPQP